MSFDVMAAGSFGIIGALGGALVGASITYYLGERSERRRVEAEEWREAVDEVYSPLAFDLNSFGRGILLAIQTLGETLKEGNEQSSDEQMMLAVTAIASFLSRFKQSRMLEEILKKKQRLIQPTSLWLDLSLFWSHLDEVENYLSTIPRRSFAKNPENQLTAVRICIAMAERLQEAVDHLRPEVLRRIRSEQALTTYSPFFNDDINKEMEQQSISFEKLLRGSIKRQLKDLSSKAIERDQGGS